MESLFKEFEHPKLIPLEEIVSATKNFDKSKVIGSGWFGKVYVGELWGSKVAIKRLDRKHEQGGPDFRAAISSPARFKHENLITLLGFCDEGNEQILVYEYASNGSLDRHLSSTFLTWTRRFQICLDVAMGLSYLHDRWVIHGDINSSNILLDANWNAKVSGSGQKRMAPASNFVGTPGYCDPFNRQMGFVRQSSDVYSFGVLLFEVLCGRLCFGMKNGQIQVLLSVWIESYGQDKLQGIIFTELKQQMHPRSLKIYSDIAYKCLQEVPEKRPTMPDVVEELETAFKYQELHERVIKLPKDYKKMLLTAADPLNDRTESELKMLLLKGILINSGKTWFSRNMNGDNCEMISIAACLISTARESQPYYISTPEYTSRFAKGCYAPSGAKFKTRVRPQFLSPRITYTVNLVFKNKSESRYIGLEYQLEGERSISYSFLSDEREDGWLTAELYQFTSDHRHVDLEIWLDTKYCPTLLVESIEFRPMENKEEERPKGKGKGKAGNIDFFMEESKHEQEMRESRNQEREQGSDGRHSATSTVEHEVLTDDNIDMPETYWEEKLPIDYKDIIKRSKDRVQWENKKDLYSILCKGFLLSYGEEWFYLGKDGKKCIMLPARAALEEDRWKWKPVPETRFKEAADCNYDTFDIFCKFSSRMLSPQTTYAAYLAYKLPYDYTCVDQPPPVQVVDKDLDWDSDSDSDSKEVHYIFLRAPQTPVISCDFRKEKTLSLLRRPLIPSWKKKEEKTFNLSSRLKIKGLPKQRSDGWMEVQVHEFQTRADVKMISTRLNLSSHGMSLEGITVQGVEFRPI